MTTGEKLNSSGKIILLKSVDSILISRFTCSPTFIVVVSILVVTLVEASCAKSKLNAKNRAELILKTIVYPRFLKYPNSNLT